MLDRFNRKTLTHWGNEYRIYILFTFIFILMSVAAPKFFNAFNLTNVLRTMTLNAVVAIGFTIVMICGHLDLSILSVINMSANIVIGLSLITSWPVAITAAILSGVLVGFINGLLVTKGKIDSFIVTLGTLTSVQGVIYLYNNGASISTNDFSIADWLDTTFIPLLPPRVIITLVLVILFEIILTRTVYGRGFFLVGGNKDTAWLSGLNTDRYLLCAFTLSGFTSALGGTMFAICLSSAAANIGERGVNPLMIVLAATVIGGTSMAGGRGSVLKSLFGVLTLTVLFNALTCFGLGYEMQIFISGLVLVAVVLYEAYSIYRQNLMKGQRPELVKEYENTIKNQGNIHF